MVGREMHVNKASIDMINILTKISDRLRKNAAFRAEPFVILCYDNGKSQV